MSIGTDTAPNTLLTWARSHPRAVMFLGMLAAFATALTLWSATRPATYPVFVSDGVYDIPAPTGAVQHCWDTGVTPVNDTGATLWDCDSIKSTQSSLGVVQCVKATGGATEPYIYCSTTGSASGSHGIGHVLTRRP